MSIRSPQPHNILLSASCMALVSCGSMDDYADDPAKRFASETLERTDLIPASRKEREDARLLSPIERAQFWQTEYENAPGDPEVALSFARALRAINSQEKAAEIAASALTIKPADPDLTEIYALSALARGRPDLAASALLQAEPKFGRQWKLYSLLGIAFDQTGQNEKARTRYYKALQYAPDHPSILTNLALSHALSGDPVKAENILRKAASKSDASMEVRQNLALILGIQGKFDEAAKVSANDLTIEQIKANLSWFRNLLSPGRNWNDSSETGR